MKDSQKISLSRRIMQTYFKGDDDKPFEPTDTQALLFWKIITIENDRVAFLGMTRYGKTDTVSMGIVYRSLMMSEYFVIVANTDKLGKVLMDKAIKHLSNNDIFSRNLVGDNQTLTDKMKNRQSKNEFTWKNGGGIRRITLSSGMQKSQVEAVIGEGTNRLVVEEASAIPNNIIGMAMRMLGDNPEDNFALLLGNALYSNHFKDSVESKRYYSFIVDYKLAIKEGRATKAQVDEMREKMTPRQFAAMYECTFPKEGEVDPQGYIALFKKSDFEGMEAKEHEG